METAGALVAEGKKHALQHELAIGRGAENGIALDASTVSRPREAFGEVVGADVSFLIQVDEPNQPVDVILP